MPVVSGNVRDIAGLSMVGKQFELIFTLNRPNAVVAGPWTGRFLPTEPASVFPDAQGDFEITLTQTDTMLDEAWYSLTARWQRPGRPGEDGSVPFDFPDWRIIVPGSGGRLPDLITDPTGRPGGSNGSLVWVGLTPPKNPRPFTYWLKQNPDQLDDPLNTSILYRWENI